MYNVLLLFKASLTACTIAEVRRESISRKSNQRRRKKYSPRVCARQVTNRGWRRKKAEYACRDLRRKSGDIIEQKNLEEAREGSAMETADLEGSSGREGEIPPVLGLQCAKLDREHERHEPNGLVPN